MDTTLLCFQDVRNNTPISSKFRPIRSILPERFRSNSLPTLNPIVDKDLTSDTRPVDYNEKTKEML